MEITIHERERRIFSGVYEEGWDETDLMGPQVNSGMAVKTRSTYGGDLF